MKTYSLKDQINKSFVHKLSREIKNRKPSFDSSRFNTALSPSKLARLELKERVRATTLALHQGLPGIYVEQLEVLKEVAPTVTGLGAMVFPDFVEVFGQEEFEVSLKALKYFTPYFSSEFAIRSFIRRDPERVLSLLLEWTEDDNHHVRRLASEGCRPRLPWSFKLDRFVENPHEIVLILEKLKADESIYVRKSVANNLNDISKDHPKIVLNISKKWIGKDARTNWILKHGLRTLLKRGDQSALRLFGTGSVGNVKVERLKVLDMPAKIGSKVEFQFDMVNSNRSLKSLRLEYAIHYKKSTGGFSKKVFKLAEKTYEKGTFKMKRAHSLRQMTTRKHYPGTHILDIIVNGEIKSKVKFNVEE